MHFKEAKGILLSNNNMNIYRGCTHGCIYCDSRSSCYQMKHDFEDIEVKVNAPELLEKALRSKRNLCMISTGYMSDSYLHLEESLRNTRKCLEIIYKYGFGVTIQTKSSLILRDLDLLKKINERARCVVQMTLTTFDDDLCKKIEPNVSTTKERFNTLMKLKENGIETVVWMTPLLPFINDTLENVRGILDYCVKASVKGIIAGFGLTLRDGNRQYFYNKLDKSFPGLKEKYIKKYGYVYNVESENSEKLDNLLKEVCDEHNIITDHQKVFEYMNEFPKDYHQLSLFDL